MAEATSSTARGASPNAALPLPALAARHADLLAYGLALLLGLGLVAWIFPADFLFPTAGLPWRPLEDTAQHAIAQRYLLADAWRWPPTVAANMNTQEGGLNTAFADSIPLLALALKAIRAWLPEGFHGVGLFIALAWVLQPVAAVWALRGAGERRLLPALGVALAAVSVPAWIMRFGHAALTGHFLLLLMLGFYLRLLRQPRPLHWAGAVALQPLTLLIHPYLCFMTLALMAAVPATLLLRGRRWLPAAGALGLAVASCVAILLAFEYLGAKGEGGFGLYSMNLASPFWPAGSGILGWPVDSYVKHNCCSGWEGYNWLGLGLLGGLAVALLLRPLEALRMVRRHLGLALALLALTALALSHKVGFMWRPALDLGEAPGFMEQFRSSGRFFWPVAYALLLGCIVLLGRIAPVLCLLLGLVQFVDAAPARAVIANWAAQRTPWSVEAATLRSLFAASERLTLLPAYYCTDPQPTRETHALLLELLTLASETALPSNTMYLARWRTPPSCGAREIAAAPFAPGELRLILPAAQPALAPLVPDGGTRCAPVGALLACR